MVPSCLLWTQVELIVSLSTIAWKRIYGGGGSKFVRIL
jgi:hypothetical protein